MRSPRSRPQPPPLHFAVVNDLKDNKPFIAIWKELMAVYIPSLGAAVLGFIITLLNSVVTLRRRSGAEYTGVAYAGSLSQCLCLSIGVGLIGGLDTLASQAFGSGQYRLAGYWMQRSRVLSATAWIPLTIILLYSKELLMYCGIDELAASHAGRLCLYFSVSYFFNFQFEALRRFANAVGRPEWGLIASIVGVPVHGFILIFCYDVLGMNVDACGMAQVSSMFIQYAILEVLAIRETRKGCAVFERLKRMDQHKLSPLSSLPLEKDCECGNNSQQITQHINLSQKNHKDDVKVPLLENVSLRRDSLSLPHDQVAPLFGKQMDIELTEEDAIALSFAPFCWQQAFSRWVPFLKIGLPAASMVCAEWWAFELLILESGRLGLDSGETSSIVYLVLMLNYMSPMSMGTGLAACIGRLIGDGKPCEARRFLAPALSFTFSLTFMFNVLIYYYRDLVINLLLDSAEDDMDKAGVITALKSVWPVMIYYMTIDSIGGALIGVVRGLGRQRIAAAGSICGFYLVSQPLVFLFTSDRVGWGVKGIWIAASFGVSLHLAVMIWTSLGVDWRECSSEARQRCLDEQKQLLVGADKQILLTNMDDMTIKELLPDNSALHNPIAERRISHRVSNLNDLFGEDGPCGGWQVTAGADTSARKSETQHTSYFSPDGMAGRTIKMTMMDGYAPPLVVEETSFHMALDRDSNDQFLLPEPAID